MFKKFTILLVCLIFLLVCYAKTRIVPHFDKDPNNLNEWVNVKIDNPSLLAISLGIFQVLAFLDGEKLDGEFYEEGRNFLMFPMQTHFFSNGPHTMVIVSRVFGLNIPIRRASVKVIFNNELSNITLDNGYTLGEDFHFSALSSSPSANYTVEVTDGLNENAKFYEKTFTGDISAVIPPEAFATDNQYYKITVRDSSGNIKFEEAFGGDILKEIENKN